MNSALILFAHGARDPQWASPLQRVQVAIRQEAPAQVVELAFLEFMSPSLPECAAQLVAAGMEKIVVLPMFIASGGHLKREVPEMLQTLRSAFPQVEFVLEPPIGEHETVIQAMADSALRLTEPASCR